MSAFHFQLSNFLSSPIALTLQVHQLSKFINSPISTFYQPSNFINSRSFSTLQISFRPNRYTQIQATIAHPYEHTQAHRCPQLSDLNNSPISSTLQSPTFSTLQFLNSPNSQCIGVGNSSRVHNTKSTCTHTHTHTDRFRQHCAPEWLRNGVNV